MTEINADFRALCEERGVIVALETLMYCMRLDVYTKDREAVMRAIIAIIDNEKSMDVWEATNFVKKGDPLVADFIIACGKQNRMKELAPEMITGILDDGWINNEEAIRIINECVYYKDTTHSVNNNEDTQMFVMQIYDGIENQVIIDHCDKVLDALIKDANAMKRRRGMKNLGNIVKTYQ